MATLPTLALGTFTNVTGATIVGTEPVLQVIASAADGSYVYSGESNTTGTYSANFALGDTPSDFGNMDTLAVRLRYLISAAATNTCTLSVQVFQSDGTTALTNSVQVVANVTNTAAANSGVITLTGLNTAANKAVWDGALVRIDWGLTKVKGGDSNQRRVTAAEITGTYSAGASETLIDRPYSATGSLAFTRQLTLAKAHSYSAVGGPVLAKTSVLSKALAFVASGTAAFARAASLDKLFSYSATGTLGKDYGLLLSQASNTTATGTPAFSRTLSRALSFAYSAVGTVARVTGVQKVLSYAATATSAVVKAVTTNKVFGATGSAVASAQKVFLNAFSVAATGTVTFAQELAAGSTEFLRSFTLGASAAVALVTQVVYRHSASATATATPSVVRHLSKLLQASATGTSGLTRLLNGGVIANIRIFAPPITIYALPDITGKVQWVDYIPVKVENTEKRGVYDDDGCFHVVALPSVEGLREWVDYMPVHAVSSGRRWTYEDDGYIPVNEV